MGWLLLSVFYCYRLTLNDIQDLLEDANDVLDSEIVILPKYELGSDEDSGSEDEVDINHISRNQLLSSAEAYICHNVDGEVQDAGRGTTSIKSEKI